MSFFHQWTVPFALVHSILPIDTYSLLVFHFRRCSYYFSDYCLFQHTPTNVSFFPPFVNCPPIPPQPLWAMWRRQLRIWAPPLCPVVQPGLCWSPTCRMRPLILRPHHTNSRRTYGASLRKQRRNKARNLSTDWTVQFSTGQHYPVFTPVSNMSLMLFQSLVSLQGLC